MKELFKLLLRFVPPYKKYLILNIFFNLLSTLLSIFSFMLIIPILEILFKTSEATYSFIPWGEGDLKDVVINNFYWLVSEQIKVHGAIWTLMLLGVWLIVMTFAKTMTSYLSSACIIPLRGGVVRDIRNFVYRKVVSLPIGFFTSEKKGDVMGNDHDERLLTHMVPARPIAPDAPIPAHMLNGRRLAVDVPKGTVITYSMIEQPEDSMLWTLRAEQDLM